MVVLGDNKLVWSPSYERVLFELPVLKSCSDWINQLRVQLEFITKPACKFERFIDWLEFTGKCVAHDMNKTVLSEFKRSSLEMAFSKYM